MVATKQVFHDVEKHIDARGDTLYVEVIKTPVFNHQKQVIGIQGVFWDVTARKLAEEQAQKATAELMRSNGEFQHFASVVSHDLHEPLRAVTDYSQHLKRRYHGKLDSHADENIESITNATNRMRTLIDDLLTYARVGTHGRALKPTSCEAALKDAVANLQLQISDAGAVVTHDALPTIIGNSTQLTRLFQNLVGNSIKYRSDLPPKIHVGATKNDNEWIITFRDNGIGIDSRQFERIFGIFQRLHTRDEYPGSGVGLAICRKTVERHGGRINVQSDAGQGSTFFIALPIRQD